MIVYKQSKSSVNFLDLVFGLKFNNNSWTHLAIFLFVSFFFFFLFYISSSSVIFGIDIIQSMRFFDNVEWHFDDTSKYSFYS